MRLLFLMGPPRALVAAAAAMTQALDLEVPLGENVAAIATAKALCVYRAPVDAQRRAARERLGTDGTPGLAACADVSRTRFCSQELPLNRPLQESYSI